MPRKTAHPRRICFVTGTRAEFGLMRSTLAAIRNHPRLDLQLIVTGMHLDKRRGRTVDGIGEKISAVVPWRGKSQSEATGRAMAALAAAYAKLRPDIVLIVGDRVEVFAAAAAAHLSDIPVAHIHGGDRAQGQTDDALRHAITKLAHIHFPATTQSALRIKKLGENEWRIHRVGSPGLDGIEAEAGPATLAPRQFALLVLHPADTDESVEFKHAQLIARVAVSVVHPIVIVHPNNDPGSQGIARAWNSFAHDVRFQIHKNIDRPKFLALLRDAAFLIGNSSAGIIEAASFGTPVIDIGPRQSGRQRARDVVHVPYSPVPIRHAIAKIWNRGRPRRALAPNPYGGAGQSERIAEILAKIRLNRPLLRKLISY